MRRVCAFLKALCGSPLLTRETLIVMRSPRAKKKQNNNIYPAVRDSIHVLLEVVSLNYQW